MRKKTKILIFLLSLSVIIILYLVITSEPATKPDNLLSKKSQNNSESLDDEYENKAKPILNSYLELSNDNKLTVEQVSQIKNRFLDLRVPTKFKDLHLTLVLALIKMENYLSDGREQEKAESQQLISQAKANYAWLNN